MREIAFHVFILIIFFFEISIEMVLHVANRLAGKYLRYHIW